MTTESTSLCPDHGTAYRTWCEKCVDAVERPGGARDQVRVRRDVRTLLAENERLRAQRDHYRRRWLIRGINFPTWMYRREVLVAEAMDRLAHARHRDGDG